MEAILVPGSDPGTALVPVPVPPSGPHDYDNCSDRHRHPDLTSPQQLHKQSYLDATNPNDTTLSQEQSQSQSQSQEQVRPQSAALVSVSGPGTTPSQTMESTNTETETKEPCLSVTKVKITKKIHQHPTLTPLRKTLYTLLLSVPPGQWTTYAALAKRLNSSARAVGTAMRLNPFAPEVPCHRVLNVDGGLGGYMGTTPGKGPAGFKAKGKGNLERKRRMLEREGVRFDERGRAIGRAFAEF